MARKASTQKYLRAVGYTQVDQDVETIARVGVGMVIATIVWLAWTKRQA